MSIKVASHHSPLKLITRALSDWALGCEGHMLDDMLKDIPHREVTSCQIAAGQLRREASLAAELVPKMIFECRGERKQASCKAHLHLAENLYSVDIPSEEMRACRQPSLQHTCLCFGPMSRSGCVQNQHVLFKHMSLSKQFVQ